MLRDFTAWMLNSDGSLSTAFKQEMSAFATPTGTVIFSLSSNVGDAFLLMDGSEVSRSTYAALFAALGTRYGDGNGSTTFTLPDMRGRSPIGAGVGAGGGVALSFRDINNGYIGEESHQLTDAEMPIHTHSWNGPVRRVEDRPVISSASTHWIGTVPEDTGPAGGDAPHNNVGPSLVGYWFIKI